MQAGYEDCEKKLNDMNALLTRPIRENEVQAIIKTLNQKAENGARVVKAIEAAKKPTDKPMTAAEREYEISYAYTNSKIIENLGIAEGEQASMKTIIGAGERRTRDRLRKQKVRAEITQEKQTAKERRDEQVLKLVKQGCTQKEIAEKLEISTKTVQRILKK